VLSLIGLTLVRRFLPHWQTETPYNDVAGVVIGVLAAVYGIVLAFVIVALYEDFKQADSNVRTEATVLAQLYTDSRPLPDPMRSHMRDEIVSYVNEVREHEWEMMTKGNEDAHAWTHVEDMYRILHVGARMNSVQDTWYNESVSKLNDLVGARRDRLHASQEALPGTFQVLLVGGAVLLVGFIYFLGIPSARTQAIMVTSVAALTAFNLLLAVVLDHPFSGDVSISPAPFGLGSLSELNGTVSTR
jgi:hypothetical protein